MQIIGGKFRGRSLYAPKNRSIRPTESRTKESLFNVIMHVYPNALNATRMLDVFAGTGCIGFEALSRGCQYVLFIDNNSESLRLIRKNSTLLNVGKSSDILLRNALYLGNIGDTKPFQILYLDPPYCQGLAQKALDSIDSGGWLEPSALVIIEEHIGVDISVGHAFKFLQKRRYRDTQIHFFCYDPT
ncbi:16S rRNA (guanine(966)-N(2))-methyltransferase RsmD [Candidatus Liberibacter sp.]|uniref:16S rRNA (guanine(966)-N(2))-methyltransferase RsmD n=1 Tax=Candidatus Liberibacter sp. TaxID=34022 RepID=UPI0015F5EA04|nr:16S rRNA (guanine(966)-N(2))-methyltransferase RsmD [Candidatus Liberibacter sp.]MBA5724217.1 16S rRNA (guanine(966)-N(2))-methyltransferase RsmD [Candidatus Liberibacter sp.]